MRPSAQLSGGPGRRYKPQPSSLVTSLPLPFNQPRIHSTTMDPLGYFLFSREEPIGTTTTQDYALVVSKKQDVSTFAFPPASSDALSTASAIAGILHGHYNADGTRRSSSGDVNSIYQIGSSAFGLQLHQQQLNCGDVASVSSGAVRADDALSGTCSSGHVMPMSSKSIAAAPPARVDELSILRSLMKSSLSPSKITSRLYRGLNPNKEEQTVNVPTLTLSTNNQYIHVSKEVKAPGHAASFPWDNNIGFANHVDRQHHKSTKALPVKGPATCTATKSKLLKLDDATKKRKTAWTDEENEIFITAIKIHGPNWAKVAELIGSKSAKQVRIHARYYGKAKAEIEAPSPPQTALHYFTNEDRHNVKKMFPSASSAGLQYMIESKWSTLKPKLKERYVKMAKKDADRHNWEMQIFNALGEHQRNAGYMHGQSINDMRAEIRSAFPNINKKGEERLLNERVRHMKQGSI